MIRTIYEALDQIDDQEMISTENMPSFSNEDSVSDSMDFQSDTIFPDSEDQLLIDTLAA